MGSLRILVVEDESIVAMDIKRQLEQAGYTVLDCVKTGEMAVELAQRSNPDLILMDIKLKGQMDGIEAAEIIHNNYFLPVIFLTSYADENTLRRARISEAFGYLMKPFEENSLAPAIEMAIFKHKLERALRESETRYRGLIETMPDAVFLTDLDFTVQVCNQQACSLLGIDTIGDLLGQNALDFFSPEQQARLLQDSRDLLETGEGGTNEFLMFRKDGSEFPCEIKASLLPDELGKPKGFIGIFRDITARKQLEKQAQDLYAQVENLARRDSLTNLYNHRYFYELAEAEFARTRRYHHPLALIIIDFDHFKAVNDTFGHMAGDQVLRQVSEIILENLRSVDIVGRIGGDEFLVLLPETSRDEALAVAGRLCAAFDDRPLAIGSQRIAVTASFGISIDSPQCADLIALVHQADLALYLAKNKGRDRFEIWEAPSPLDDAGYG